VGNIKISSRKYITKEKSTITSTPVWSHTRSWAS